METPETMIPIVLEGVKWVQERLGPTKKDLKLKVSDLESQVRILSYGNKALIESMEQIIFAILEQLKSEGQYTINANNIVYVKENKGTVTSNSFSRTEINNKKVISIFDDIDLEIQKSRLKRPSEEE